jgi:hypothetical protein
VPPKCNQKHSACSSFIYLQHELPIAQLPPCKYLCITSPTSSHELWISVRQTFLHETAANISLLQFFAVYLVTLLASRIYSNDGDKYEYGAFVGCNFTAETNRLGGWGTCQITNGSNTNLTWSFISPNPGLTGNKPALRRTYTTRGIIVTTVWIRVIDRLIFVQMLKWFPVSYSARIYIKIFTPTRLLLPSWISWINFRHSHAISSKTVLILSCLIYLALTSGSFPQTITLHTFLYLPMCLASQHIPSCLIWLP